MEQQTNKTEKAILYQSIRRRLTLFHLLLTPALLGILIASGWSFLMRQNAVAVTGGNDWGSVAVYFFLFSVYFLIFDLPLDYYSGFVIEHRFGLSNQDLRSWAVEFLKKASLSFAFSLVLLEALYFIIRKCPGSWWLWAWTAYAFVSYGIGKLFPVFIVPLFYKYGKLEDKALEDRVLKLAARFGMPVQHVYSLDLSKTTKKANAAFMGIGRTKRVVLSDTLISNFTHDEIETVLAHELGHYKHHDVWRLLGLGLLASLAGFGLGFWGIRTLTAPMGLNSAADIAGLPLLFLIFYAVNLILMPALNGYSRHREREADLFALRVCGKTDVFISCMEKLGSQNLADPAPPVWYEWLFYDHPAIHRRVEMARQQISGQKP
ncbi:MAG TPA: M48 family metallopeptidase [Candidatus Omnitrophota bacterium]|nr:M48 family metallopeptidase [Candidatus Omnitrophota bacterium]HPS37454.1 M48 family metallopeptidase [Candidatus Omnitrophota bacterium]